MFKFLLFVLSASEVYEVSISTKNVGYTTITTKYSEANIFVNPGVSIMLVEWDDVIVNIGDIRFIKEAGFSFFTFVKFSQVHMYLKSNVSFFYFPFPTATLGSSRLHVSNLNNDEITIYNTDKNVYLMGVGSYNVNAKFQDFCQKALRIRGNGQEVDVPFSSEIDSSDLQQMSSLHMNDCSSEGTVTLTSTETFTPSVPTSIDVEIKTFSDNMAYGGFGDSKKSETVFYLNNYKYIFVLNNISNKNADKVRLTVKGGTRSKEIKSGEIFKDASFWDFNADYTINTKRCKDRNIMMFVSHYARKIILDDNNQPYTYAFNDIQIPDSCLEDDKSDGSKKIGKGGIAGIVIAVIVVIAIIIIVIVVVLKKRKQNHSSQEGNIESKANEV